MSKAKINENDIYTIVKDGEFNKDFFIENYHEIRDLFGTEFALIEQGPHFASMKIELVYSQTEDFIKNLLMDNPESKEWLKIGNLSEELKTFFLLNGENIEKE